MGKRYSETTKEKSALPGGLGYALGINDKYHEAEVKDKETGQTGRGIDTNKGKSIDKAYKELREKQGK